MNFCNLEIIINKLMKIEKILKIKKELMTAGINTKYIAIMPEKIHPIAYGQEKTVIFTEIAGIPIVNIVGVMEED